MVGVTSRSVYPTLDRPERAPPAVFPCWGGTTWFPADAVGCPPALPLRCAFAASQPARPGEIAPAPQPHLPRATRHLLPLPLGTERYFLDKCQGLIFSYGEASCHWQKASLKCHAAEKRAPAACGEHSGLASTRPAHLPLLSVCGACSRGREGRCAAPGGRRCGLGSRPVGLTFRGRRTRAEARALHHPAGPRTPAGVDLGARGGGGGVISPDTREKPPEAEAAMGPPACRAGGVFPRGPPRWSCLASTCSGDVWPPYLSRLVCPGEGTLGREANTSLGESGASRCADGQSSAAGGGTSRERTRPRGRALPTGSRRHGGGGARVGQGAETSPHGQVVAGAPP